MIAPPGKYRVTLTLLMALLFSQPLFAIVGFTDWSAKTPLGHEVNNYSGPPTLYLQNNTQLDGLGSWYFYRHHIIGTLQSNSLGDTTGYFVVNERIKTIRTFSSKAEWTADLDRNHLHPDVITRWYDNDWTFYNDGLFAFLFFGFFISVPFVFFYLLFLYRASRREKLHKKGPYTITITIVTALLFLHWLSEKFPQSF